MNERCCKGKAIPPVPVSMKKLLHLLLQGPHSLRSASQPWLRCTGMPGWMSRASHCLYKNQELQTHTRPCARTHRDIHTNTHVMLCMQLMALKFCQELLSTLKEKYTLGSLKLQ